MFRLTRKSLAAAALSLGLAAGAALPAEANTYYTTSGTVRQITATPTTTQYTQAQMVQQVLYLVNQWRAQNGRRALVLSGPISSIAQNWSNYMVNTNVFAHNPNYYKYYPAGWYQAGENIASNFSPQAIVQSWKNSPGHNANMLNANFTHIGIGATKQYRGTYVNQWWVTNDFAAYR